MLTLYYVSTSHATYKGNLPAHLRQAGCSFDRDAKQWFANTTEAAAYGAALFPDGSIKVVEVERYPTTKAKPRGRGFRRGSDYRRTTTTESELEQELERELEHKEDTDPEPEPEHDGKRPTEPTTQPLPLPSRNGKGHDGNPADQLADAIRAIAGNAVNADTVREIVAAELAKQPNRTVEVRLTTADGITTRVIKGQPHKVLADVLEAVNAGFRNIYLVGPAGSGKTTLAAQVAEALGLQFASVSASAGMSESALVGRLLPTGDNGRFEYVTVPFVTLFEQSGVFLLDEGDAADANTLLVANSALSNGHLDLVSRFTNPRANRHPNFVFIVAANTYGNGANRLYVGRNQLDAAFLDRFAGAQFELDYDRDLERAIVTAICPDKAEGWLKAAWAIRDSIESVQLRRIWGTRSLMAGAKWLAAGKTLDKVLAKLFVGWTADERQKVSL